MIGIRRDRETEKKVEFDNEQEQNCTKYKLAFERPGLSFTTESFQTLTDYQPSPYRKVSY